MITRQGTTSRPPIIVTTSQTVAAGPQEVVGFNYVNTTAGAGRVEITNGNSNEGVVLGSDAQNGNNSFVPGQAMKFSRIIVTFTGTGYLTILVN